MPRDFVESEVLPSPASEITDDVLRRLIGGRAIMESAWSGSGGKYCITTAVWHVNSNGGDGHDEAIDLLAANLPTPVVAAATHERLGEIWLWHDAKGRTKEEALSVFDRAIASRRASLTGK